MAGVAKLHMNGAVPSAAIGKVRYNGESCKEVRYNGHVVWRAAISVKITNQHLRNINIWSAYFAKFHLGARDYVIDFSNCQIGSNSVSSWACSAGAFPSGSTLTIILSNGTVLSGRGGNGGGITHPSTVKGTTALHAGTGGGNAFDSNNVHTDIYVSGVNGAKGYLYAGSGGGGASWTALGNFHSHNVYMAYWSVAGSGGAGIPGGSGGTVNNVPADAHMIFGSTLMHTIQKANGHTGGTIAGGVTAVSSHHYVHTEWGMTMNITSPSDSGKGGSGANPGIVGKTSGHGGDPKMTFNQHSSPGASGRTLQGSNITIHVSAADSFHFARGLTLAGRYTLVVH